MLRFLPLLILIQIFCLYHAYKNNVEQKWFWLIILVPFFGCLIYLYYFFFNQISIDTATETDTVASPVKANYKTEKLEQEVQFSSTVANKVLLAEEYINIGEFEKAINLLESCLIGTHSDDPEILLSLVKANYLHKDYPATISYGRQIEDDTVFLKSEERIAYARALAKTGEKQKAEEIFQAMDHQYSNYKQRLEYCNFLIEEKRTAEAKAKLEELIKEIDLMERAEKALNRPVYDRIKQLLKSL